MSFVLERKEINDTSDVLEAFTGTLLLMANIAYDELTSGNMEYFDSRLDMIEQGLNMIRYARKAQLKEVGCLDATEYIEKQLKDKVEKAYLEGITHGKLLSERN